MSNQPHTRIHALRSELPPRRLQARQMAQGFEPCSVMMQQSPHKGLWQRAQGPAAVLPQAQRAMPPPPSPVPMSCPVTHEASRSQPQRASLPAPGGRLLSVAAVFLVCTASVGCGGSALSYSGQSTTPTVRLDQLQERSVAPNDCKHLGKVEASCHKVEVGQGFEATAWSDISCSAQLLRNAIARKAVAQGATLLVAGHCEGLEPGDVHMHCSAELWRSPPGEPSTVDSPTVDPSIASAVASAVAPTAHQAAVASAAARVERAWQVLVDSHLTQRSDSSQQEGASEGVRADDVRELAVFGTLDSRLGDLTAYCETGQCDDEDLRGGLRAAAGRIGADSLVAVRCFEAEFGPRCVASIARSPREL